MSTIIYNPKFITVLGRKTVNVSDVKNFVWSHARWSLKTGEMKKFPDDVGAAMLRQINFLIEVTKDNYDKIKAEVEEKKFKCENCDFETNTKIAFISHAKTHEKTNKLDNSDDIEEAAPIGEYRGTSQTVNNPEEGIPSGGTRFNPVNDKDGVGWYGGGVERDSDN
jgi:hypothetical protein